MATGDPAYLDYNATAPVRPEVQAAMAEALGAIGNPSSVHAPGRRARSRIEQARRAVARLVGAEPDEVIFTSGGTEANTQALRDPARPVVAVSAIEHDSVLAAARKAARIAVGPGGVVDLGALERLLHGAATGGLVSVMAANNETGVLQPVAEIARLAHDRGLAVHCDAVQAAGKIALDVAALDLDFVTLSAHKLGGPAGVGALIVRGGAEIAPLLKGGGQEQRRRAGTENVAGIVGFGRAAELALDDLDRVAGIAKLRDRLEREIHTLCPEAPIHGASARRLPNTSCIGMPGVAAELQVMAFDLAGVAVSAGAACSSGKVGPSHVLAAMGLGPDAVRGAVRFSLGWASTAADIDRAVRAWAELYRRKQAA